jgi:uncharacterized membrane protein YvbJ
MIDSLIVIILGLVGVLAYFFRKQPEHEQQIKNLELKKEEEEHEAIQKIDAQSIDDLVSKHNDEIKRRDSENK